MEPAVGLFMDGFGDIGGSSIPGNSVGKIVKMLSNINFTGDVHSLVL